MAQIGSLTANMRLESAAFIRDLGKASNAIAANTNAMRKSLAGVYSAANMAKKAVGGFITAEIARKVIRLTEDSLKLAASFDGPLTKAAQDWIKQSEEMNNAFQFGVAHGFLESFNSSLVSSADNLRTINDLGSAMGRAVGTSMAAAAEAAKPFAEIISQIATGFRYIATTTPSEALDDILGIQRMQPLDFQKMTGELGSGVSAWDAYTQSVKRANDAIADTSKVINVAFPDIEKLRRQQFESSVAMTQNWLSVGDTVGQALGTMFKENKAVAIGQAVVNTAQAITEALKLPFPINWAQVAAVGALGAAQIATITSTNPGTSKAITKSGGAGSGVAKAAASTGGSRRGGAQQTAVNITLNGGSRYTVEEVRGLIGQINEAVGDGATLRVR